MVQGVTDPAQLYRQAAVPALLVEAFGAQEGESVFREGTACIQEAQSELSVAGGLLCPRSPRELSQSGEKVPGGAARRVVP